IFNMMFNANLNINCVKMCLDYVKQRELRFNCVVSVKRSKKSLTKIDKAFNQGFFSEQVFK
ncbi:MAG: hypothetical protein FWF66_00765, partial [Candidatus Bathyarchaeota archaeon]|nr:hypothetical protein [Candidatus Termiticorpusculum sp.]